MNQNLPSKQSERVVSGGASREARKDSQIKRGVTSERSERSALVNPQLQPTMSATAVRAKRQAIRSRVARKEVVLRRSPRRTVTRSRIETELIEKHMPLVRMVVGRLQMTLPSHVDVEDLNSAGLLGLLDAIRNYNPRLGSSFESYARVRIRGSILDELRRMDWVPRSVHRKARRVQLAIQELEQRKHRTPTPAELAAELNLTLAEYHQLLDEIRPASFICLDAAVSPETEDSPSHYEALADPSQEDPLEGVARREMATQLAELINELPAAQRKVLALYYYEDMRLREIAEVFGLTESRICQIHAQAVMTLKAQLRSLDTVLN
jgi:RNA polymerase sigma factor FliA